MVPPEAKESIELGRLEITAQIKNTAQRGLAEAGQSEGQSKGRGIELVDVGLSRIEFGAYIGNLMDTLRGSMDDSRGLITYRKELEEVRLDIQTAIPCGFIVNELVSNALKHAFPGGRGGEVFVSLRQEKDGSVILTVQDDGIGLPPGTSLKAMDSMGMQLVMMLVQQIDGTIRTEDGPGAKFVLIFRELKYKPRI